MLFEENKLMMVFEALKAENTYMYILAPKVKIPEKSHI